MVASISSARFADVVVGYRIWRCVVCVGLFVLLVSLLLGCLLIGICGGCLRVCYCGWFWYV